MQTRSFGRFGSGSVLALGGAGVASHWGAVTRDEGLATLREAVAPGVTLLDMAPKYGDLRAEQMVGDAFDGTLPTHVKVLTKVAGGRLLGWGMSAICASSQALRALADTPCPEVVEAITNPLDALCNTGVASAMRTTVPSPPRLGWAVFRRSRMKS